MKKLFVCMFGLMFALPAMAASGHRDTALSQECKEFSKRTSGDCYQAEKDSKGTYIVTRCHDTDDLTSIYINKKGKKVKSYLVQNKTNPKQNRCFYESQCKIGGQLKNVPAGKMLRYWFENGIGLTDETCIDKCTDVQTYDTVQGKCVNKQQQQQGNDADNNGATVTSANNDNNNNDATDTDAKAVQESVSALDKIFAGVKANKWRDDEGNFNTARLASDMTAGVVLGTAGALITSSVVKKNQVESGFEDIKCTISGQNVAEFGDDFTVGVK